MTTYIWQHPNWPHFVWDEPKLNDMVYTYALAVGGLLGDVTRLSEAQKTEAIIDLMVSEAVKTSQIEGENFDREDVRSSIRNQLGLNAVPERVKDPRANGVAALMLSVRENFAAPLTAEQLWAWQDQIIVDRHDRARLETGRWRADPEPMQIISGAYGAEKVHYEAPPSDRVPAEMEAFLTWFNQSGSSYLMKGPIRAGIAHLYFECIHPFSDGNGRVGRAISEIALSQELGHPILFSLSTTLQQHRKVYYDQLNQASLAPPPDKPLDITPWLLWFTQCVIESQAQAAAHIRFILAKTRFWDQHTPHLNERQSLVLKRMLKEGADGFKGGMNAQKYMKLTDCSKATATRDLADLLKIGALQKLEGGGRSTRYDILLTPTNPLDVPPIL